MNNKVERLEKLLNNYVAEHDDYAEDIQSLKEYEYELQDIIETVYPENAWWDITNHWDIFYGLFWKHMSLREVADKIIDFAKKFKDDDEDLEDTFEDLDVDIMEDDIYDELTDECLLEGISSADIEEIDEVFVNVWFKAFNSREDDDKYKYTTAENIRRFANKLKLKVDVSYSLSGWNNEFTNIDMRVVGFNEDVLTLLDFCTTKLNLEIGQITIIDYWGNVLDDFSQYMAESKEEGEISNIDLFFNLRDGSAAAKEILGKYFYNIYLDDNNEIKEIPVELLKNMFAVSPEQARINDFKTRDELEKIRDKYNGKYIVYFNLPEDEYTGEYSIILDNEDAAKEMTIEFKQDGYAVYDENGEFIDVRDKDGQSIMNESFARKYKRG